MILSATDCLFQQMMSQDYMELSYNAEHMIPNYFQELTLPAIRVVRFSELSS